MFHVCERVWTLGDAFDGGFAGVPVDEDDDGAGLGFVLEDALDTGRSVVAAVSDVTVDFALECPNCRSFGAVATGVSPDELGLAATVDRRTIPDEGAAVVVVVAVVVLMDGARRKVGALANGFVAGGAPFSVDRDVVFIEELPETCLEVKPVGALDRVVVVGFVVVVVDEDIVAGKVDLFIKGFMGRRLGDTFLVSICFWAALF